MPERHRAVSPVIGVVLMVVITLLLTSIISYQFAALDGGLDEKRTQYDDAITTLSGNPWSGEPGDFVRVSNNKAGATEVKYRVNFTIQPGSKGVGSNLGNMYLEVTTGSPDMFSNTDITDVMSTGIDTDGDGRIDLDITDDIENWNIKNGGSAIHIGLNTTYTQTGGDSIIITFDGVDNPTTPGEYELRAETNGDDNWHNGTITIVE